MNSNHIATVILDAIVAVDTTAAFVIHLNQSGDEKFVLLLYEKMLIPVKFDGSYYASYKL
jgi:hypothetical protein